MKKKKKYWKEGKGNDPEDVDLNYLGKQLKALNWVHDKGQFEDKRDWFDML